MYTSEEEAVKFLFKAFKGSRNKYTNLEKALHSILVGLTIKEIYQSEDIVVAAYLHNIINDTQYGYEDIEEIFGSIVADIVAEVSEDWSLPKWLERKKEFLNRIRRYSDINVLNIIVADKLQELLSYKELFSSKGDKLWSSMNNSSKSEIAWLYREVYNIALEKGCNSKLLSRYKREIVYYFGEMV